MHFICVQNFNKATFALHFQDLCIAFMRVCKFVFGCMQRLQEAVQCPQRLLVW